MFYNIIKINSDDGFCSTSSQTEPALFKRNEIVQDKFLLDRTRIFTHAYKVFFGRIFQRWSEQLFFAQPYLSFYIISHTTQQLTVSPC